MKKHLFIAFLSILLCGWTSTAYAQSSSGWQSASEWQSTSVMQGSGSAWSSQVTPVGATEANQQATTTASYSPARISGPRRNSEFGPGQDGGYQDPNSPLGEPWVMLAFAAIFAIGVAYRNLSNKKNRTIVRSNSEDEYEKQ